MRYLELEAAVVKAEGQSDNVGDVAVLMKRAVGRCTVIELAARSWVVILFR
jgi:hypothetical protein